MHSCAHASPYPDYMAKNAHDKADVGAGLKPAPGLTATEDDSPHLAPSTKRAQLQLTDKV